jgi:hypothetical protein
METNPGATASAAQGHLVAVSQEGALFAVAQRKCGSGSSLGVVDKAVSFVSIL